MGTFSSKVNGHHDAPGARKRDVYSMSRAQCHARFSFLCTLKSKATAVSTNRPMVALRGIHSTTLSLNFSHGLALLSFLPDISILVPKCFGQVLENHGSINIYIL